MATATKKDFSLTSHDSGNGAKDERPKFTQLATGEVLVLLAVAVPVAILFLVVSSVLVGLCG